MVQFFSHCVEEHVSFITGDSNGISVHESSRSPAGAPSKLTVIEAAAWEVFVNRNKQRVRSHKFIRRPHEVCLGIYVQYNNDMKPKVKTVEGTGNIELRPALET